MVKIDKCLIVLLGIKNYSTKLWIKEKMNSIMLLMNQI